MQHTTGVAVLATHLAHTDRRALSQAWYSALHLTAPAPAPRAAHAAPAAPRERFVDAAPRGAPTRPAGVPNGGGPGTAAARLQRHPAAAGGAGVPDRRSAKTELTARIVRGLGRRTPRSGAASFAIRTGGARVHLAVRTDGARTRVVAVCPSALRERVERALAHARFALAGPRPGLEIVR